MALRRLRKELADVAKDLWGYAPFMQIDVAPDGDMFHWLAVITGPEVRMASRAQCAMCAVCPLR